MIYNYILTYCYFQFQGQIPYILIHSFIKRSTASARRATQRDRCLFARIGTWKIQAKICVSSCWLLNDGDPLILWMIVLCWGEVTHIGTNKLHAPMRQVAVAADNSRVWHIFSRKPPFAGTAAARLKCHLELSNCLVCSHSFHISSSFHSYSFSFCAARTAELSKLNPNELHWNVRYGCAWARQSVWNRIRRIFSSSSSHFIICLRLSRVTTQHRHTVPWCHTLEWICNAK